jgi:DNA-binding MarR family transcriptional regulator
MRDFCKIEDPFGDDLGLTIRKVFKLWQRIIQRCLDESGLTPPQMELLGAIIHLQMNNVEVTQIALSQETNIDPMTTSTILRNMQKKGFITRKESKTDTRARIVEITDDGYSTFLKALSKIKNLYDKMFIQKEDKEAFRETFIKLQESLTSINKEFFNN